MVGEYTTSRFKTKSDFDLFDFSFFFTEYKFEGFIPQTDRSIY